MLANKLHTSLPVRSISSKSVAVAHRPQQRAQALHATTDVELKKDGKGGKALQKDEKAEKTFHPQPSSREVENFLAQIVNKTDIAEMNLQVGSFELRVKRSTGGVAAAAAEPPTLVIKDAPPPSPQVTDTVKSMDESVDESLVYVPSPKVGIFTRGKYVGGKRVGKGNVANKGDQLKRGQTLGYVEQLGTYVPVEAPQAGEVVAFLVEEGAPVEYKQIIVEMAPFFGGHIIGDSKYA